jgi:hypothetical protein
LAEVGQRERYLLHAERPRQFQQFDLAYLVDVRLAVYDRGKLG